MSDPDEVRSRVFASLVIEPDADTVEAIVVELSAALTVGAEEVEAALRALTERGWARESSPGHWERTTNPHGSVPSRAATRR